LSTKIIVVKSPRGRQEMGRGYKLKEKEGKEGDSSCRLLGLEEVERIPLLKKGSGFWKNRQRRVRKKGGGCGLRFRVKQQSLNRGKGGDKGQTENGDIERGGEKRS